MQMVTVKLNGAYQDMFQKLKRSLKDQWITGASTSEVIRYAIYTAYCYEKDKPKCAKCFYESKNNYSENKSLTNKSKSSNIKE